MTHLRIPHALSIGLIIIAFSACFIHFIYPTEKNLNQLIKIDPTREIVFGQTGMLSGHFEKYARAIRQGILAYFEKVNTQGGIDGKQLRLISLDDFGKPEQAENNIQTLLNLGIDMFIGNMGTRSLLYTLPLVQQKKIALFFPWGGDIALRNPSLTNIINGLGLLEPQIKALITYTIHQLGIRKIAIFHADDAFSTEAQQMLVNALASENITPVAIAAYNRYTLDIKSTAKILMKADPKAVFCIASGTPVVKLVHNFFENGFFGTTFLGVDSTFFARDILAQQGVHFYVSSSVPDTNNTTLSIVQEYQQDLALFGQSNQPNILSLAYYIGANIIVQAIKSIKEPLSKEKIISSIEKIKNVELGGFPISFDPNTRHIFGTKASIIKG